MKPLKNQIDYSISINSPDFIFRFPCLPLRMVTLQIHFRIKDFIWNDLINEIDYRLIKIR